MPTYAMSQLSFTSRWIQASLVAVLLFVSLSAQAVLRIEIKGGTTAGLPIAIVPFAWAGPGPVPADVADIVSNDLALSGQFDPIEAQNMLAQPSASTEVNYLNWRTVGVDNVVVGSLSREPDGRYLFQFELLDVLRERVLLQNSFRAKSKNIRYGAHHISDLVYEALTGQRGAFNTQIAYVALSAKRSSPNYELIVADIDGENPVSIWTSSEPIVSPAWSPDGERIAYTAFAGGRWETYIQKVVGSTYRDTIVSSDSFSSAPAWSPDGKQLAITLHRSGNTDIYIYNIASRRFTRLTESPAIDTEAAWAPDGRSLVFTSDRGGRPQIYKVSASGGKAERLSFEGKENTRASFAPDGKSLVMASADSGFYRIVRLNLRTGNLQTISDGKLDESPSFSPNGAIIVYASQNGSSGVLAASSSDGRARNSRLVVLRGGEVREPAWSPFFD